MPEGFEAPDVRPDLNPSPADESFTPYQNSNHYITRAWVDEINSRAEEDGSTARLDFEEMRDHFESKASFATEHHARKDAEPAPPPRPIKDFFWKALGLKALDHRMRYPRRMD